jgi:pimeloyl-ACP methyl ester carboxylesterase
MGGTIAQALAVLHPAQVCRLVPCATFPGTGRITPPSQAAAQALTSGNVQEVMADLFRANQAAAQQAYQAALPGARPGPGRRDRGSGNRY